MTAETVAITAILIGMVILVVLAIISIKLAQDGYKHRDFERTHGSQDTDEVPIGKVRLGLYMQAQRDRLEDFGGPAKPVPPRDDDDGTGRVDGVA